MAWTKSGEDRVRSYRLYRELESAYAKVMEENEKLKETLRVKDDLIRRLAHEVATLPVAEATAPVRSMAAEAYSTTVVPRSDTIPVKGDGDRTVEVTESGTIKGLRPERSEGLRPAHPPDELAAIPTPPRKKRSA